MNTHLFITVPLTDLRREPSAPQKTYGKDPLQETQLLLGEKVRLIEQYGDWLYIEALEQPTYSPTKGWQGYHGWIQSGHALESNYATNPDLIVKILWAPVFKEPQVSSNLILHVSIGTHLQSIKQDNLWWQIILPDGSSGYIPASAVGKRPLNTEFTPQMGLKVIAEGEKFLGFPYHWGGRSAYSPGSTLPLTGVDCSGLSNLLYRLQGMDIPRNAHEQFLKCRCIEKGSDLKPGDLVFCTEKDIADPSARMGHVMLYVSQDRVLEATMPNGQVHYSSFQRNYGQPIETLLDGAKPNKYTYKFGRITTSV